ncbi:MAG TPA: response regulator, partial [Reyranella sp.]|nr:response regulator [Reyranella sp.]
SLRVSAQAKRVLVVEDEVLVAMLIEDMLRELGCEIAALSSSLEDAVERARTATFDFAVLDVNLNGRLSFPVAEVVRSRGLPFVFATGYGAKILAQAPFDVPVLQKPFGREELQRVIALFSAGRS